MARASLSIPATVVVVCLIAMVGYPVFTRFHPELTRYSWQMYSGRHENPVFVVQFEDGTSRAYGPLMRRNSEIRVLGPSVDQAKHVPPWLCRRWPNVREIRLIYRRAGYEEVVPCAPGTP